MPTAYELLSAEECDDILVIDLESRTINIPKNVTVLGVESDDETRVLHFQVPRHYCNVDLSEFSIRINYRNANNEGDLYIVAEPVIEDELIKFDWVVGRHAFARKGDVEFSVTLKDVFEGIVKREFNTTIATLPVLEGMEPDETLTEAVYDYIEQWGATLVESGDSIKQEIVNKGEEVKGGIGDAVYEYVEEHSEDLRGPKGDPFMYDDFTEEQLLELTGPTGPQGEMITSIERTSGTGAAGTTDTYTITTNAGKSYTFSVYNGADGNGAGDMLKSVYDPTGKAQDIFAYVDDKTANSNHEHNFSSMAFLGENITGGSENDTTDFWKDKDGRAWFNQEGMLADQPSMCGFVINVTYSSDIFQIFRSQSSGPTYWRSGNAYGWSGTWAEVYDANTSVTSMVSLGDNPTGGVDNDTVDTWSNLGFGVAWISEQNQVVDQPSQYGFIHNYVHEADIFQIFHSQTNGETYVRSGDNVNNWFQNWRRLVIPNSDDYIAAAGLNARASVCVYNDTTSMTMLPNGITDKSGNLWIGEDGKVYFKEVYASDKKLATEESVSTAISNQTSETFTFVMDDGTEKTVTVVTK